MRFLTLATDYDGTLATAGVVAPETAAALVRWRASGRTVVLVTGRVLDDLRRSCPDLTLFDRIIAEDGAILYRPQADETLLLCEPVSSRLIIEIREQSLVPFALGRVVVAASRTRADAIVAVANALGIAISISYNKNTVMVLPAGVDKGSGLMAALRELGVPVAATVAMGDAENDVPLLRSSGRGIAVANALPEICRAAHKVTMAASGAGVVEAISEILATDP